MPHLYNRGKKGIGRRLLSASLVKELLACNSMNCTFLSGRLSHHANGRWTARSRRPTSRAELAQVGGRGHRRYCRWEGLLNCTFRCSPFLRRHIVLNMHFSREYTLNFNQYPNLIMIMKIPYPLLILPNFISVRNSTSSTLGEIWRRSSYFNLTKMILIEVMEISLRSFL